MGKGKKRSRTSKQHQKKAVAASAKQQKKKKTFGGVVVTKGGHNRIGGVTNSALMVAANMNDAATSNKNEAHLKKRHKPLQRRRPKEMKEDAPQKSRRNEFDEQMKSLEERNKQEEWTQKQKGKQQRSKSLLLSAAPSMLRIDDKSKSTTQLLQEATTQIDSMQGMGFKTRIHFAAASSGAWTVPAEHQTLDLQSDSNNPYATLYQDDSEEEVKQQEQNSTPSMFQFQPPSFAIPISQHQHHQQTNIICEPQDDPDL